MTDPAGAGILMLTWHNMTGVYWWDPWHTIYSSTMDGSVMGYLGNVILPTDFHSLMFQDGHMAPPTRLRGDGPPEIAGDGPAFFVSTLQQLFVFQGKVSHWYGNCNIYIYIYMGRPAIAFPSWLSPVYSQKYNVPWQVDAPHQRNVRSFLVFYFPGYYALCLPSKFEMLTYFFVFRCFFYLHSGL